MAELSFEKRLYNLPTQISPDTVYLLKTVTNDLEVYVSDANGSYVLKASGSGSNGVGNYRLTTTPKIPVIDNRILLPSIPVGDILHNLMLVYVDNPDNVNLVYEYDDIYVMHDTTGSYAVIPDQEQILGHGVVSYLARI